MLPSHDNNISEHEACYDLAIIGRGLIGSSAARHAAKILGGSFSTSISQGRIVLIGPSESDEDDDGMSRCVYGEHYDDNRVAQRTDPDPVWAELASRSMARYDEIYQEWGGNDEFFVQCGHLTVGPRGGHAIEKRNEVAERMGMHQQLASLDFAALCENFPYLNLPKDYVGLHETAEAGHISSFGLARAAAAAATNMGVEIINGVVHRVERYKGNEEGVEDGEGGKEGEGESYFHVHIVGGDIIKSRRVLVAAGVHCNDHKLLPKKLEMTPIKTQSIHFILSDDDAEKLNDMPSIIAETQESFVYILPPTLYPDFTTRLKVGGAYFNGNGTETESTQELQWGKEVVDRYQSDGSDAWEEDLIKLVQSIIPNIESVHGNMTGECKNNINTTIIRKTSATVSTPTGQPYVGKVQEGWAVAIGGNGLAAKGSDELGRLASLCILDEHSFEKEAICGKLCKDIFSPRYESVCTLFYKHGQISDFPVRIDSVGGNEKLNVFDIKHGLDKKLLHDIREWTQYWRGKRFPYYQPKQEDEKEFIDMGKELRRRLQEEICYNKIRVCLEARPIREVKLMNEYTESWPLWCGLGSQPTYISQMLRDRIEAWGRFFDENFHFETGWRSPEQEHLHEHERIAIKELLHKELDADPRIDWFVT